MKESLLKLSDEVIKPECTSSVILFLVVLLLSSYTLGFGTICKLMVFELCDSGRMVVLVALGVNCVPLSSKTFQVLKEGLGELPNFRTSLLKSRSNGAVSPLNVNMNLELSSISSVITPSTVASTAL